MKTGRPARSSPPKQSFNLYFFTPYSAGGRPAQIYGKYIDLVPDDGDWVCFTDRDVMFLTPDYGHQIMEIIARHPDTGIFTCLTNRIGCPAQTYDEMMSGDPNILNHQAIASDLQKRRRHETREISAPVSGFLMVIQKKVWRKARFDEQMHLLDADRGFATKISNLGLSIRLMLGVYVFHYHRLAEGQNEVSHLAPQTSISPSRPQCAAPAPGTPAKSPAVRKGNGAPRKSAVLMLSHLLNEDILGEYKNIAEAMKDRALTRLLLHVEEPHDAMAAGRPDFFPFTNDIFTDLPCFAGGKSVLPGNAHWPLVHFFLKNRGYDYYWLVEYDVRFSGDWLHFFASFDNSNADFLSSCLMRYADDPEWYWWSNLLHPRNSIRLEDRLRSFNPIYRISNAALACLHACQREGWTGHFEVLMPTLLYHHGFKLADIGGHGRFVEPGGRGRFYTEGQTFRWRPGFAKAGSEKNKLYHPVKPDEPPPE